MSIQAVTKRRKARGFTFLELIVAVTMIAFLSSTFYLATRWTRDRAYFAQFASDIRAVKIAAQRFEQDVGVFPPDVWRGVDPGLVEKEGWMAGGHSAKWDTVDLSGWKGPYLEKWDRNPWGGLYDWDNYEPGTSYMGITGGAVYLTLKPSTWGGTTGLPKPDFEDILEGRGLDQSPWTYCVAVRMGTYPGWNDPAD